METVIIIVAIAFLIFMVYSMVKYAKFIHQYPQQTEDKNKPIDDKAKDEHDLQSD